MTDKNQDAPVYRALVGMNYVSIRDGKIKRVEEGKTFDDMASTSAKHELKAGHIEETDKVGRSVKEIHKPDAEVLALQAETFDPAADQGHPAGESAEHDPVPEEAHSVEEVYGVTEHPAGPSAEGGPAPEEAVDVLKLHKVAHPADLPTEEV